MTICKLVLECIDQYPEDGPIFIEEIKEYVIKKCKKEDQEKEMVEETACCDCCIGEALFGYFCALEKRSKGAAFS